MTHDVKTGTWEELAHDARLVRTDVFVVEQNIPIELEWDDMDACCLHAVAYNQDRQPIGTGRLLPDAHIGRMAVKRHARNQGVGGVILAALMQAAKERGDREVVLNAQLPAEAFYARFGFVREGTEFMDAGIPHICMRYRFT